MLKRMKVINNGSEYFTFSGNNDDLLGKTRFQASPYQLYYVRDDQEYVLRTEEVDSSTIVHKVIDDEGIWSPDDYQLCIGRSIQFVHISVCLDQTE